MPNNTPITEIKENQEIQPETKPQEIPQEVKSAQGTQVLPEVEQRKQEIQSKYAKFKHITLIVSVILGVILVLALATFTFFFIKEKTKKVFEKTEEPAAPVVTPEVTDIWSKYDNSNIKITLLRPNDTRVLENKATDSKLKNIEIIHTPSADKLDGANAENLTEGYIFRITPLEISQRTLDEISKVKRESFLADCPKEVQISDTLPAEIYGINSNTFDVRNCNGDFKVTYVPRFGIFYEIMQLYRGDLGFRQKYKSTTEEILKSLTFYPEEVVQEAPYKTYENKTYKFSFTYPKELAEDCCELPEPPSGKAKKLISLGSKKDEINYGAFGVFSETPARINDKDVTFDDYVFTSKEKLISDYKVVNGAAPTVVEEHIDIGGRYAVRFKGLSWKGNDLIFIKNDEKNEEGRFLTISVKNTLGEEFETIFKNVLKSFKFEEQK